MRRRAFVCLAMPAGLLARPALALRADVAPASVAQAFADRCRPTLPSAAAPTLCPFCGCPVLGGRDHGEAGPLR